MTDPALAARLQRVRDRVRRAAEAAGRDPAELTLVVVTKFQPLELVQALAALGVADFGESRHQEARAKADAVADVTWHFVGQLQGNKARQAARYVDVVHSVDRTALVGALAGERRIGVFLQVDLGGAGGADGRGGAAPAALPGLAAAVQEADGLRLLGVMGVPPLGGDPDEAYARLAGHADRIRALDPAATAISAGMSGDLEAAVRHGATHLRIGTAITGPRPARV